MRGVGGTASLGGDRTALIGRGTIGETSLLLLVSEASEE